MLFVQPAAAQTTSLLTPNPCEAPQAPRHSFSGKEARRTLRKSELVVLLLDSVLTSYAMRCEVLSRLLWYQRHSIAELFEAVDMVTFDASSIPLVKVISSQIAIPTNCATRLRNCKDGLVTELEEGC